MNKTTACFIWIILFLFSAVQVNAQRFLHPGIDQGGADLALMKQKVRAGEEPYKAAFEKLKAATDTSFQAKAHTHVLRGPYGKPNIGGDDLSRSAAMAYNYAVVWYITDNKEYAEKAIAILDAWSPVLWDFDYNDAKLLAAWTGHQLCNAAEILRYTKSGWQQQSIDAFSNMLMTAYYPLFRFYYPQANGNWDGAIIHSILAIAVFTDNRAMFNNALDHYLYGPVNGSIFKYIYPGGQCQETTRDQAHVQLGLGEFAGAAQIAFTQGRDLLSIGNNRLAQGYEFTASYLMGKPPFSYGPISPRATNLRDDYEYVYRHYRATGVQVPFTKMAADSIRPFASRSVLTAIRASYGEGANDTSMNKSFSTGIIAGAQRFVPGKHPARAVMLKPGDNVQHAINNAAGTGRWVVLKEGVHKIPATLMLPSGTTLAGEGIGTILFLDPEVAGMRDAIANATNDMHDITIRDLKIEGSTRTELPSDPNSARSYRGNYNRGGILFRAAKEGQMKNIRLLNLSLENCTYNGVFISGASNVSVENCDLSENGGNAVPGPALQHNLRFKRDNLSATTAPSDSSSYARSTLMIFSC
ncbi:MAG: hypothetical protein EOP49_24515, partial [Sphingobacteriales bacterium]